MKVTKAHVESYHRDQTCLNPDCDGDVSDGLEFGSTEYQGDAVYQEVSCTKCGWNWDDRYIFAEVRNIQDEDKNSIQQQAGTDWEEIVETLLNQTEFLPTLIGINPDLDELIERKLKEAPAEKDSTYVVHHPEHGLWTGNGWGTQTEARQYDDPDAAQDQADALSLAALGFKHDVARAAAVAGTLEFTVRGFQSGKRHTPKPLVDKPKHLFVREGHRERNQK